MLEELKFSIGGMEGWTTVDVKVEKEKVHYVTENLFIEIMDTLYPFIDADAIQSIFIGFYAINSKYREQIDINRKDGAE